MSHASIMLSGCPTPSINRRGSPERRQPDTRRLVIGRSDANRVLTLVIEETVEPTTWLLITGWDSTPAERKMVGRS
jgi:hypothetical protein